MASIRKLRVLVASAGALATICLADLAPGAAQQNGETPTRVPGREISALVRTTIVAVHNANLTGNYTVLRDLGDNYFRTINTAVRLSEIFAKVRHSDIDLAETVLFDPYLTEKPVIDGNGLLLVEGFFPTEPMGVVFKMGFRYEFGRWRIFSLSVGAQPLERLLAAQRSEDGAAEPAPEDPPSGSQRGARSDRDTSGRPGAGAVMPKPKPERPQE